MPYQLFVDAETTLPLVDASVRAMRRATSIQISAAHLDRAYRQGLAAEMGIGAEAFGQIDQDATSREVYVLAMARTLLVGAEAVVPTDDTDEAREVRDRVNVPEVHRAVRDFFTTCGLPSPPPSP